MGCFFISLFLLCNTKFDVQDIFGKLSLSLWIFSFEIWIPDEEVMSFFLYLNLRIHAFFFLLFLLLKNASTLYPFKFCPPLILDPSYRSLFLDIVASNVIATVIFYEQKLTSQYVGETYSLMALVPWLVLNCLQQCHNVCLNELRMQQYQQF